ncbi:MAG: site-2 protease family protein [Longilinea sp.]|nr:site-2 protease family protein [Longilinea sp.]
MDDISPSPELLDSAVRRVFRIEDITLGNSRQEFLARYHGQLMLDSEIAYDQLSAALQPYQVTPLFRMEEGRQTIILVQGNPKPKPSNPKTNLVMFILTLISVWVTGGFLAIGENDPIDFMSILTIILTRGWQFAISMIAILGAHEMGHYWMGRHHKVDVTLPYFIPLPYPISPFGTMGAFINMREIPRNRKMLLDIGIAGPLAGLIVAIPILLLGIYLSPVQPLPGEAETRACVQELKLDPNADCTLSSLEGNSILYLAAKYLIKGELLPAPIDYGDRSNLQYWIAYLFTGHPLPFGGRDILLHPVAWAGWAGLLVTALNLIPAGQLDGGHLLFVLLGSRRSRKLLPVVLIGLAVLSLFWTGWLLWVALIFFLGRAHAEPLDQITPLDTRRKLLAVLLLVIFILVFVPVPMIALQ